MRSMIFYIFVASIIVCETSGFCMDSTDVDQREFEQLKEASGEFLQRLIEIFELGVQRNDADNAKKQKSDDERRKTCVIV